MRNNSKKELTKQEEFMRRHRRHHHEIALWRALVFVLFLALWELSADLCWIDSFFFSSPSRVVLCLVKQIRTNSMLFHIGVTLFETIASFLLVLFFSLVMSTLLWCSTKLSEVLEPYLVVLNSLPKSALAPLCPLRLCHQLLHRFPAGGQRKDHPDLYAGREQAGRIYESSAARLRPHASQHSEGKYRSGPCRRDHRGISGGKKRPWLSDHLWIPGIPAGHGDHIHHYPLRDRPAIL